MSEDDLQRIQNLLGQLSERTEITREEVQAFRDFMTATLIKMSKIDQLERWQARVGNMLISIGVGAVVFIVNLLMASAGLSLW